MAVVVDGPRGHRFFGPPAAGVTVAELAAQNLVRGVPGFFPTDPTTLWTAYDAEAGTWTPAAGGAEALRPGHAFRWYLLDRDGVGHPAVSVSRSFPFVLATERPANTANVDVTLDTRGTRFNYLANPFGTSLDLSGVASWNGAAGIRSELFVYDEATAAWAVAPDAIGPWEAFRFRAAPPRRNGNPRVLRIPASAAGLDALAAGLEAADAADGPGEAPWAPPPHRLAFRLDGATPDGRPLADGMLTVAFADGASPAFDPDEDVEKFQPPATAYALLGARAGAALAGYDVRPAEPAEVPLAFEARGASSAFTLSWDASALPPGLPVVLVDLATGAEVDVRTAPSYRFEAASRPALGEVPAHDLADGTQAADRFVLRIGDGLAAVEAPVTELALGVPAPNPTSGAARVAFAVPEAGPARLAVYDVRGREVAVLVDRAVEAGRHEATLEASGLAAGVYVVRLEAGGRVLTTRAAVVR